MLRVGIVSIYHESNTFAETPTTLADFERHMLAFGSEFARKFNWKHHEVSAFFDTLTANGVETGPILMASALPGGTIGEATSRFLLEKLSEELERAGRLDGYMVAPHGAGVAEGTADLDGRWLVNCGSLQVRRPRSSGHSISTRMSAKKWLTPAMR